MQYNHTHTQMMACRQLAMEQNQKLFNEANALSKMYGQPIFCYPVTMNGKSGLR